ncbi:MAG: hypothetical protein K8R63_00675 [Bacteroidales bacterium]|nr:hypothetical protein [Bacteroidales bacterium]
MKKSIILYLILSIVFIMNARAQNNSKTYFTTGGEFIFSFASIDNKGDEGGNVMRFNAFLNLQGMLNHDFNNTLGIFTGLAIRNVGFIYNNPETGLKKKYRTYNIGIPVGFKLGAMNKTHLYAGYEIEFPTNYKEKTFHNERKDDKFNVWFTSRVPTIYNTVFVGIQFRYGINLKFKYYLTNFFNQSYTEVNNDGITEQPFKDIDVRIFYVSLNINLFRGAHFSYSKEELKYKY